MLWAVGGNVASRLIDRGASPLELTAGRSGIALAGVGAIVLFRRTGSGKSIGVWLHTGRWGALVAFGLSLAAANFTYYAAISLLPVAVAIVIQYTAPALVVIWKAIATRRRPTRRVLASLGSVLVGVVLLSEVYQVVGSAGTTLDPLGIVVAFGSAVAFTAYILLGEVVGRGLGSTRSVFYGFAVATIFWSLTLMVRGRLDTLTEAEFLPGVVFLGVVATIAPFLLFVWGLGVVSASPAGIISTLEPVSAAVIAYLWLGQSLEPLQGVGAAAVIGGIAVVQADRPISPQAP